ILFVLGRSRIEALDMATRLGKDLAASEARANAVMESAVAAILTTDAVGHVESVNPAAEVLFGWAEAEIVGRPITVVVPGLEPSGEPEGLDDLHRGPSERMVEAIRKDEQRLPVDVSMSSTTIGGREMFTLIARDATLRKLYEDQLEHQATHDPLTGLANRTLFDELLVRAAYRADRSGRPVAVLYLDLDGFKDVNDVFGHPSGDRVLSETSRRLEAVVRPGDMVARMGGDEFVVLCEHLSEPGDAGRIATRIVPAVGKPIPLATGGGARQADPAGDGGGDRHRERRDRARRTRRDRRLTHRPGGRSDVPDEAGWEGGLPVRGRGGGWGRRARCAGAGGAAAPPGRRHQTREGRTTFPALMQLVQAWIRRGVPSTSARTRWTFGSHLRLIRLCEKVTDLPNHGFFPQISHTAAIASRRVPAPTVRSR